MKRVPILGLGLFMVVALQAQDRRTRIDVDAYAIDAQINPSTQTLAAKATVRFVPVDDNITSVTFELNNALAISKITDEKGEELRSSRNQADHSVRVTFPGGYPKGQPVVLTFQYEGHLTGVEESPVYGIKFAEIDNDFAFLLYPSRWFPISGYTTDRFAANISVTVPNGFKVIGSGLDSNKPAAGGGTTWTFQYNKPGFPGNISMVKDDGIKVPSDGLTTTMWFRTAAAKENAKGWGESTARMMGYFTGLFGIAPYANLQVVETVDGAPNGYSAPGILFLAPRVITKDVNENVLANQVARQWWEVQTSPATRNHMWLENGMALYAESLWAEHEKGAAALEQRVKDNAITALTIDNVPLIQTGRMEDYSPEYWALSANKGAAVIQMLRATIGDEAFFKTLKEFQNAFAYRPVNTEDFRLTAEKVYGQELRYFFLQWVESNGAPEFRLEYTIFRTQKGFRVQGKISQDLDTFRMPVELKVETEGNPELKTVEVMGTSSEFSIDTFGKPKKITIDPNNHVLRLSPQVRVQVAIRKGEQFAEIGENAEALKEYQRALDTAKNSSMAHYRVAEIFFRQHNYQSAANEFRSALDGDSDPKWIEVWAHIYLGNIYDITGQRERAVNEYTQAQRTRDNTQGAQDEVAKYLRTPYKPKSNEPV